MESSIVNTLDIAYDAFKKSMLEEDNAKHKNRTVLLTVQTYLGLNYNNVLRNIYKYLFQRGSITSISEMITGKREPPKVFPDIAEAMNEYLYEPFGIDSCKNHPFVMELTVSLIETLLHVICAAAEGYKKNNFQNDCD